MILKVIDQADSKVLIEACSCAKALSLEIKTYDKELFFFISFWLKINKNLKVKNDFSFSFQVYKNYSQIKNLNFGKMYKNKIRFKRKIKTEGDLRIEKI